MCEKIRKYSVAGSFLIVLAAFAFLKGTPGDSRAAEIMKQALLTAAMLYDPGLWQINLCRESYRVKSD